MRRIGVLLSAVGVLVIWYSLRLPTTLNDQASQILGISPMADRGVLNIGLLHDQMMVFIAGVATTAVGMLTAAAGQAVATLLRKLTIESGD